MAAITLPNIEGYRLMNYSGSVASPPPTRFSSKLPFWPSDGVNFILKSSVKKAKVVGRITARSLW